MNIELAHNILIFYNLGLLTKINFTNSTPSASLELSSVRRIATNVGYYSVLSFCVVFINILFSLTRQCSHLVYVIATPATNLITAPEILTIVCVKPYRTVFVTIFDYRLLTLQLLLNSRLCQRHVILVQQYYIKHIFCIHCVQHISIVLIID